MENLFQKYGLIIALAILIIIPFLVFNQAGSFELVWDDTDLYLNQSNFPEEFSFEDYTKFWNPAEGKMFMPVTYTVWTFAYLVSGSPVEPFDKGFLHHLNIIVHILNGIILFFLLRRLFKNDLASMIGALIFSVHPLQIESVAWVSELRGLLAAFFGLISLSFFVHYRQSDNKGRNSILKIILSAIAFLLAILSKPSAMTLVLIILTLDLLYFRTKLVNSIKFIIPYAILVIPVMLRARAAEAAFPAGFEAPIITRPFIFFDSLQFYLSKLVLPLDLVADYGRKPSFVINEGMLWYSWIIPMILLGLLIFLYRKHKEYLTGYLFFISGFLALSGIVSFYFQDWSTVADRYLYISMAGISLSAAYIIKQYGRNRLTLIASGVIIVILGLLSYQQVGIWKNELTLWDNNIKIYPERSAHAYMGRGLIYSVSGNPQQAISDYNKAIELNPKYTRAWYNRGNWYFDAQDYQKAISDFTEAVRLGYNSPSLFVNRGLSYAAINKHELAIADYTKSLSINQNQPDVYVNRGNSYAISGNFVSAVEDFKKALELNPTDELAMESLRMAEEELNKMNIKNGSNK